jgi:dihydrofolate reductase
MTKIEKEIEGDTYNPITDEYLEQNYDLIEESEEKESNGLIYKFNSYEKKS